MNDIPTVDFNSIGKENHTEKSITFSVKDQPEFFFTIDHVPNNITCKTLLTKILSIDKVRKEITYPSALFKEDNTYINPESIINQDHLIIAPAPSTKATAYSSFLLLFFIVLICFQIATFFFLPPIGFLFFFGLLFIYCSLILLHRMNLEQYQFLRPSSVIFELMYWFIRSFLPGFTLEQVTRND